MSLPVAVAQFAAGLDKQENLKFVSEGIKAAADRGARLVVTPEFGMYHDPAKTSEDTSYPEPLDGPWLSAVREVVRDACVHAVVGFAERLPEESRAANTVVAIAPDGSFSALYRKVHLYDAFGYRESDTVVPAEITDPATFELDGFTFGIQTCYDIRFPESSRRLVDGGADVLLVPAAWAAGPAKEEHWLTLLKARAIENTSYLLAAGQTGPHCTGQSVILDPMGVVVAGAGEAPGTAVADLDQARIESVRGRNPALENRRFRVVPA
ncbi:carbon-nitrogen hydrolase family protein [Amycolatopsis minnesotensis]|uniref:Carbon-nitrogen hydrolase family protein n=1 Tax=Amycolatopsis minnesotensis TaxID=337894 RepID=A0ABN2SVS7_9PSEU